jgi:hypothetical protein
VEKARQQIDELSKWAELALFVVTLFNC